MTQDMVALVIWLVAFAVVWGMLWFLIGVSYKRLTGKEYVRSWGENNNCKGKGT